MKTDGLKAQFGKYKGRSLYWIAFNDLPYALWLRDQSNSNTRTKRGIKSIIDKYQLLKK